MEETLRVINRMVEDGIIETYAIGGAVAAIFYIQPINTHDVDIFFHVKSDTANLMILAPLYEYLAQSGYEAEGDAVNIENWLVQFLPVFNSLIDDAVREARDFKVGEVTTRVMQSEHLMAIMLQTGRQKDYARLAEFIEQKVFDETRLNAILLRHNLLANWQKFLGAA